MIIVPVCNEQPQMHFLKRTNMIVMRMLAICGCSRLHGRLFVTYCPWQRNITSCLNCTTDVLQATSSIQGFRMVGSFSLSKLAHALVGAPPVSLGPTVYIFILLTAQTECCAAYRSNLGVWNICLKKYYENPFFSNYADILE